MKRGRVAGSGWYIAILVAVLCLVGSEPAAAELLRQDFSGTVDSALLGNPFGVTPGPAENQVSGFAIYDGTILPPGPAQLPAVQIDFTLGNFTYACFPPAPIFPPTPCMTAVGGPGMLFFDPQSGDLTGIDVMVPPGPNQLPGIAGLNLFVAGNKFDVTDPVANSCPAGSVVCGTLDFSNSTPVPVPEPASLALLGAAFAAMGVASRRKVR
jgi:PEP-CTERM motif